MKNLKELLLNDSEIELKEVSFDHPSKDKVFAKLRKRIESMEKEYEVDYEDLKKIKFVI